MLSFVKSFVTLVNTYVLSRQSNTYEHLLEHLLAKQLLLVLCYPHPIAFAFNYL